MNINEDLMTFCEELFPSPRRGFYYSRNDCCFGVDMYVCQTNSDGQTVDSLKEYEEIFLEKGYEIVKCNIKEYDNVEVSKEGKKYYVFQTRCDTPSKRIQKMFDDEVGEFYLLNQEDVIQYLYFSKYIYTDWE